MADLNYLWACVLGAVQGLTEFLPVSSSAHLALTQQWAGLEADSLPILLFDAFTHVGTVASIFYVLRGRVARHVGRLHREWSADWQGPRYATRVLMLMGVSLVPTAAIGFGFKERFEKDFADSLLVGLGLVITGVLLAALAVTRRGKVGWKGLSWFHALIIGVAQGISIEPGISRSGATICAATFLGLRPRCAAEFSFSISVPAILGATFLKLLDLWGQGWGATSQMPWGPILVGTVVAFVVGVVGLRCVIGALQKGKLQYFAIYCWVLGAVAIIIG